MLKKLVLCLLAVFLLTACSSEPTLNVEEINVMKDIEEKEFDFEIHATSYFLADMSTFEVLYKHNADKIILPASITKLFTLDTILHEVENLDDTSSISKEDYDYLIEEDSSLAGLQVDYDYTILDLLYGLILPSGGDAALALSNYFANHGMNLVEEMNKRCVELECTESNFTNTIGLHDDDLHTSVNDIYKVVMDLLTYPEGREILTSLSHEMEDGNIVNSTTRFAASDDFIILGGKTGYTPEAGRSIVVLYKHDYHSYLLILMNAMDDPDEKSYYHYEDCRTIFKNVYN